jgi:large subunit ribosomal protein L7/L12
MMTREDIISALEEMTVKELIELKDALEEKWGVQAAAPVAAVAVAPGAAEAADEEEKDEHSVLLVSGGQAKVKTIKALTSITGKGLKECKALVDQAASEPVPIKEKVPMAEAEKVKAQLEEVGAVVEIK